MLLRLGLQTKILLLVVCGLVVIFAVFSYLGLQTLTESTQRSLQERLVVARLIAAHSDEHLAQGLKVLSEVADSSVLDVSQADSMTRRVGLSKLLLSAPLFNYGVFVIDRAGRIIWSEPRARFPLGTSLPGFDSVAADLAAGRSKVSDLLVEPGSGAPIVELLVPVRDSNNVTIGAVGSAGNLLDGGLSLLLEPIIMGRTGYAEIVDRDGMVIASSRKDRLFQKDDHADRFFTLIKDKRPVVGTCHRCHQTTADLRQNDVLAFTPMQGAEWGVALRQLEDEVLAPTRDMATRIALVALPLFALAVAAAWITTSRVVRPIRQLTEASERIANGDLDFAVKPFGRDELGALAAAFDAMRVKLKVSHKEIEDWNRDLERRVEQRTRDLSTIFEASQIAASTLDLDTLLREIVARLVTIIHNAGAGTLYLFNEEDGHLAPRSSHGYEHEALSELRLVPGEGIAGKAFRAARAMLWPDPAAIAAAMTDLSPSNAAQWREAVAARGPAQTAIGLPLVSKGRAIGCLLMESFVAGHGFGEAEVSLLQTIADRIAVAIENARLYEEVQRKEQLRGELLEKVIVAQEEERKRIARELHDETGQSLTALAISLAAAEESLPPGSSGAIDALGQAKVLAEKLLSETRRLISDLRPTVLDDLGLVPALRRYASTHAELLQLDIELRVEGRRRRLSPQAETALYRIVQEAITNVAKHAEARHVTIELAFEERGVRAVVEDDGKGFDVGQKLGADRPHRAVGLLGMRERATLLGGHLEVVSQSGVGTKLAVSLPLEGEEVLVHE